MGENHVERVNGALYELEEIDTAQLEENQLKAYNKAYITLCVLLKELEEN